MLAHVLSFGWNPRGSPDFLAYPVSKACMHVLGTRVPRCLGVAPSASSPKAAQALGCSLTPLHSGFGCAPALLARLSGFVSDCVCLCLLALLAPRHSGLGCAVWVCVLKLGFRLRSATPGWAVVVCVFVCVLPLYPADPGWGARRGCVCLGSDFGCAPPLLAGVLGCVCGGVGAPLVPHHSWLGCAVWVCVFGLRF